MRSNHFRALVAALAALAPVDSRAAEIPDRALTIAVMDPLAKPLSCACDKGFAQRDYDRLGTYLEKRLDRKVRVVYGEALQRAIRLAGVRGVDLVIGKQSVVKADAKACGARLEPIALLSDKQGKTTLTGLFVVPAGSSARAVGDLKGYRVIFGPGDSEEKHSAAVESLRKAGIEVPEKRETQPGCSEAAFEALEHDAPPGAAAVISSYAIALLEGCGTIEKGALRIVGETAPVPFVTAFADESLSGKAREDVVRALLSVREDAELLRALESKDGFVRLSPDLPVEGTERTDEASGLWPGWRGPRRDGIAPWLPERLAERPREIWRARLGRPGLGGIAATTEIAIVSDRDPLDLQDVFVGLDVRTGERMWEIRYAAPGNLDYGNSPRATPLIAGDRAYLLGAFGHLSCVGLEDGEVHWKKNVVVEFGAKLPKWGMCSSPLRIDDALVVNPGARDASLAALALSTGDCVWRSPGRPAAYASFIAAELGYVRQIVGYDEVSLGGWDARTGARLWHVVPGLDGDYNVPTPIVVGGGRSDGGVADGGIVVSTENNGTRLYRFGEGGLIVPSPVARNDDLAPDTTTGILLGTRHLGSAGKGELLCLDVAAGLETLWAFEDGAFTDYVSILGCGDRALVTSARGELLLLRVGAQACEILSRARVLDHPDEEIYSHPAIVGRTLFVRGRASIAAIDLGEPPAEEAARRAEPRRRTAPF